MASCLSDIRAFLALPSVAIAGVSRKDGSYSRAVFNDLRCSIPKVIPVNREADEIDGEPCVHSVADLRPASEGVILLVHAGAIVDVARECILAGVKMLWMRQGESASPSHSQAAEECQQAGLKVIEGECPLMFLRGGSWIHHAHAGLRKLVGTYPV